eukprot:CAMPEP_0197697796 /NCGR_PEP_ID=MMETSP1338-20131121/118436_1 /TAXON_ID=43686 ORGANISM="Pelagodinium beii, Strain RCC1491" /NCGR_SAMPLE_ID=MMETSP1338 /ASSEMBLY_ACC=CAM_ASM_000754 /LENGTH=174 /DNA_ID=CAMNT_0043281077 /DNA_START=93 /DNA_END=614 /DNA_ORIENTATION=-
MSCAAWLGVEFSQAIDELDASNDVRVRARLASDRMLLTFLLSINGLLCLWAWQYYHGVHSFYRKHLFAQGPAGSRGTLNAHFFAACPPEAYLSELQGIELILGAADTCLVNMPVLLMSWSTASLLPRGLGPLGHLNLFISVATYVLNLWLCSDRAPGLDAYRLQFGGWESPCPC